MDFDLNLVLYKNKLDLTPNDIEIITNINNKLAAHFLFNIDLDYLNGIYKCDIHYYRSYLNYFENNVLIAAMTMPCGVCKYDTGYSIIYKQPLNMTIISPIYFDDKIQTKVLKVLKLRMYITFNKLINLLISKKIELLTIHELNIPNDLKI